MFWLRNKDNNFQFSLSYLKALDVKKSILSFQCMTGLCSVQLTRNDKSSGYFLFFFFLTLIYLFVIRHFVFAIEFYDIL